MKYPLYIVIAVLMYTGNAAAQTAKQRKCLEEMPKPTTVGELMQQNIRCGLVQAPPAVMPRTSIIDELVERIRKLEEQQDR